MWKDVKGWEKYYQINENGDIKNKQTNKLIMGDINSAGYHRVCLYNKNNTPTKQRFFRHRLVAQHFIDNPNNFPEVNHIDSNKNNNNYLNLEWTTRRNNELHSRKFGSKEYKPFYVIYETGKIKNYDVKSELANELFVSIHTVKTWLHGISKGYLKHGIVKIEYI